MRKLSILAVVLAVIALAAWLGLPVAESRRRGPTRAPRSGPW